MAYTKLHCLPKLINTAELKDELPTIAYVCYFNGVNLIQNQTLIETHAKDLISGYLLKKKHLIDHPFP